MRAIIYNGPFNVTVKNVPDAKIERPGDALIRITTTNICGSDLHMYEAAPVLKKGAFSAMKTWERSLKSAKALSGSRWETASVCRLTSAAASVKIAKKA